jgi:hypothetical protein
MKKQISWPMPRYFLLVLALITLIFFDKCSYAAVATWTLLILSMATAFIFRKSWSSWTVILLYCLWIAATLSPVDVAIRSGSSFKVHLVKVFYSSESSEKALDHARSENLIENVDFVIYPCGSPASPNRAILFVMPLSKE